MRPRRATAPSIARPVDQIQIAPRAIRVRSLIAAAQRTLAVTLAADVRADAVLAKQEAMVRAQRQVSDAMTFLVPPALVNDALVELAGNGSPGGMTILPGSVSFIAAGNHSSWNEPAGANP